MVVIVEVSSSILRNGTFLWDYSASSTERARNKKHEDAMPSKDGYSSYHTHGGAKTGRHVADRGYRASFVEL